MINEAVCEAWEKIEEIKDKLKSGVSLKACEKEAEEPLETINAAGRKLASDNDREYTNLTFRGLID